MVVSYGRKVVKNNFGFGISPSNHEPIHGYIVGYKITSILPIINASLRAYRTKDVTELNCWLHVSHLKYIDVFKKKKLLIIYVC